MSENDVLIEMRRLRGELGQARDELVRGEAKRRRSSSFETGPLSARRLRDRVGIAMLLGLALAVGLACWLLYTLLARGMGAFFEDLLPHPVRLTVNAFAAVLTLFF